MRNVWKGALLVSGEPGTGKSYWIRQEARNAGARMFRWNARVDRSLREGREVLHQQVRSKESLFVWVEGADDLTQEAQAFLRRVLETASPNVTCVLEVRELWRLSPPILSRCTLVPMSSTQSFRQKKNHAMAAQMGFLTQEEPVDLVASKIPIYRKEGKDCYAIVKQLTDTQGWNHAEIQEMIRAIGAGSSPWVQIAHFLLRQETTS